MREVLCLHLGQGGVQIGNACWEMLDDNQPGNPLPAADLETLWHSAAMPKFDVHPDNYSAKQIGGYAWAVYGLLIFGNVTYYADLIYRNYCITAYNNIGLAGENMMSAVNFSRIVLNYIIWLVSGFFWVWTFSATPNAFFTFSNITIGLAGATLIRLFLVIIGTMISFMWDNDEHERYSYYDHFQTSTGWGADRAQDGKTMIDIVWVDIELEMANIMLQFFAFPLYNYGINNYWRQEEERIANETGTTEYYCDHDCETERRAQAARDAEANGENQNNNEDANEF